MSFDAFIELISVLEDIASDFLYHSVIHVIQLRNSMSTSLLVTVAYFSLYKHLF